VKRALGSLMLLGTLTLPGRAQPADPFEGTFQVTGVNPDGNGRYEGTLILRPRGQVYEAQWSVAGAGFEGVGLVVGGNLSVGYWASDKSWTGVVVYKVGADNSLSGVWAGLGATRTGTERAVRRK
jgi:hypothetical protein